MRAASWSVLIKAAPFVVAMFAAMFAGAAAAQEWEQAPVFQASSVLPPELRGGAGWSVDETVANDGFVNHYTVRTGAATLAIVSTDLLRIRAQEFEALAKMDEIKRN